jgi:hypothetical protein
MKIRCIPVFAFALSLCLGGSAFADITGNVETYFNDFLGRLAAKHQALESLAMPGREVRGVPGNDDPMQAVIILGFESAGERETFQAALEAENIPLVTFPGEDRQLLLFTVDMAAFIMRDAIGL